MGGPVFVATTWNYGRPITPNDTPDANSQLFGAKYLLNSGVDGFVTVTQAVTADGQRGTAPTALTSMVVWLPAGASIECGGSWRNVKDTGTDAGVVLYALH